MAADDFGRNLPRFQGEAFQKNLDLVQEVRQLALEKNCTVSQLALIWVLAQGPEIVPIPGTKHVKYLEDNLGALNVHLGSDDLARIKGVFPRNAATGERYPAQVLSKIDR